MRLRNPWLIAYVVVVFATALGMLLYLQPPDRSAGIVYEVHYVSGMEGVITEATELYLEVQHDHQHESHTQTTEGKTLHDEPPILCFSRH